MGVADAQVRYAGGLVALGLTGVLVTCGLYVASPAATVLPSGRPDYAAALVGAMQGRATIRAAGIVGVIGDAAFVAGALLLAARLARATVKATAGWALIVLSGVIFTLVDMIAAFALAPAASTPDAFFSIKLLFDALFLTGTFVTGLGIVLLFRDQWTTEERIVPRWLAAAGIAAGIAALAGASACLAGAPAGHVIGLSIAASSLTGGWLGLAIARRADGLSLV